MYFDLEPKSRLKDLYDFDQPFGKLMELLKGRRARAPLITVTGARRTGKTSLIKTALAESGLPHVLLSGHAFADEPVIGKRDLMTLLERGLNDAIREQKGRKNRLMDALHGIEWVRLNSEPPWIHFEWKRPARNLDALEILYSLDQLASEEKTKYLLVLDEAQEFKRLRRYSLQRLMAYAYDNLSGIQMIVSGSQFGFLHEFLGVDDPQAPLFGRGMPEIRVPRLPKELAADFLEKGFKQVGVRPDPSVIELAARKLDGVIGWLTFFGSTCLELGACTEKALGQAMKRGSELSLGELRSFFRVRPKAEKRYRLILEAAARVGRASWTDLKRNLEIREHKLAADKVFNGLLENLVKGDFLEKNEDGTYSVPDPMLVKGLTRS